MNISQAQYPILDASDRDKIARGFANGRIDITRIRRAADRHVAAGDAPDPAGMATRLTFEILDMLLRFPKPGVA